MNMVHDEYLELQNQLQDHFDGRYVQIEYCEKSMTAEGEKVDGLAIEFAKSNTKLNILIGILSAIAVPILGVCVKMLFS